MGGATRRCELVILVCRYEYRDEESGRENRVRIWAAQEAVDGMRGRAAALREVMVFWCICEEMLIVVGRRGPSGLLLWLWNKVLILGQWILRAK
jgi:hypothetical protein